MYVCMLSGCPIQGMPCAHVAAPQLAGKGQFGRRLMVPLDCRLTRCYSVRDSSVEAVGRISLDKLDTKGIESTSPHWMVVRCELSRFIIDHRSACIRCFFCIRMFTHALFESTVISHLNDSEITVLSDLTRDRTSTVRQFTLQVARLQVRVATLG